MSTPILSLEQAQKQRRCRICGDAIPEDNQRLPDGWMNDFREMVFPIHVILNFGKEYAHAKCLNNK